jgi:uncharacterized protein YoaH (UPF0181 family)
MSSDAPENNFDCLLLVVDAYVQRAYIGSISKGDTQMAKRDVELIEQIREMLANGMSTAEIADAIHDADAESADAEAFEEMAYGIDDRSTEGWTYGQVVYHDRLSMGRNDAGEWLGFM